MAVTRTDRDRRILGDRVVARAPEFGAIDEAVGRAFALFAAQHDALTAAIALRLREESDDEKARRLRDEAAADAVRQYAWAWHQLPSLLGGSWTADADEADLGLERQRLFPLGAPNEVADTHQRTLDGVIHLATALAHAQDPLYPEAFRTALAETRDRLARAIDAVTTDGAETKVATDAHLSAREAWDRHWQALREITAGFLRLQDQLDRHAPLFRPLARRGGQSAVGQADPEATPDDFVTPDPAAGAQPTPA